MPTIRNQHKTKVRYQIGDQLLTLAGSEVRKISAKEFNSDEMKELMKIGDVAEVRTTESPAAPKPKAEASDAATQKNQNTHKGNKK